MSTLTVPFVFSGGTFAVAAQVNSNFSTLYGWVNGGSAVWADASRPFTAVPSGPSADPTLPNHLARKSYVNAGDTAAIAAAEASSKAYADANFMWQAGPTTVPASGLGLIVAVAATCTPNGSGNFNLSVPGGAFPNIMDACIPFVFDDPTISATVFAQVPSFASINLTLASTGAAHATPTTVGAIFIGH